MERLDVDRIADELADCRQRGLDGLDRRTTNQAPVPAPALQQLAEQYTAARGLAATGRIAQIKTLLRDGISELARERHVSDADLLRDLFFGESLNDPIRSPGELLKGAMKRAGDTTEARFRERRATAFGYFVDAVEISKVGAAKIRRFAADAGVADRINVVVADIINYTPNSYFDVIVCNGVLHYIDDKKTVVGCMQDATVAGGINVISLWSAYTAVPDCHKTVDIFCDDEDGIVCGMYQDWDVEFIYFDRNKTESSHAGMPSHSHSHIKLIARRPR